MDSIGLEEFRVPTIGAWAKRDDRTPRMFLAPLVCAAARASSSNTLGMPPCSHASLNSSGNCCRNHSLCVLANLRLLLTDGQSTLNGGIGPPMTYAIVLGSVPDNSRTAGEAASNNDPR